MDGLLGGTAEPSAAIVNCVPHHQLHSDHDPIDLQQHNEFIPSDAILNKQPKVRKVASGPPLPSYKGKIRVKPNGAVVV